MASFIIESFRRVSKVRRVGTFVFVDNREIAMFLFKKTYKMCSFIRESLEKLTIPEKGKGNSANEKPEETPKVEAPKPEEKQQEAKPAEVACNCKNCNAIMAQFAECNICMNPLQNTRVNACYRCGEMWCGFCSKKVSKCPYCRAAPPSVPSVAIAKIIKELYLPCRNHRWGCKVHVTANTRRDHEAECPFGQIVCPFDGVCETCLPLECLATHITLDHRVVAMKISKLSIVLENFAEKMCEELMTRNKFKLCMIAFGHAFLIKLYTFNYDLSISIMKKCINYEVEKENVNTQKNFNAIMEFKSPHTNLRQIILLADDKSSRVTLIKPSDYLRYSWEKVCASIIIRIHPIENPEEFVFVL